MPIKNCAFAAKSPGKLEPVAQYHRRVARRGAARRSAAREALIITSYYDSNSVVPDLAPGAEQAMSLAAMLNLVKALAPYKGQLRRDIDFRRHGRALPGA